MPSIRRIAGAMSGTSADGVDVAIVELHPQDADRQVRLVHHEAMPYPAALRQAILDARTGATIRLADLAQLSRSIADAYADTFLAALRNTGLHRDDIQAIAAHGQTLYHQPPLTLQWIDPAWLAWRTRVAVISDFRRADCAAGGQGAPLVPYPDYLLCRSAMRNRILLNIGGIANLTVLPAGAAIEQVSAWDTGPGNCISDAIMRRHFDCDYDADGARAAQGTVRRGVVDRVLAGDYWKVRQSTDVPAMQAAWERACNSEPTAINPVDQLATACALTVEAIGRAIDGTALADVEVFVSGGGTRNATLMNGLRRRLPRATVRLTDELGIPSQAKEAVAFALLGAATLDGRPGNVPSATGAARPVVLGAITPVP